DCHGLKYRSMAKYSVHSGRPLFYVQTRYDQSNNNGMIRGKFKYGSLLFISVFILSCGDDNKEPEIETIAIEFKKEGELQILKNGNVTRTIDIEIADTPYEWETGLMYRESMEENQGMLFIYPNAAPRSFYMKNTYIPLDIIFMTSDTIVLNIKENAQPRDETSIPSS